MLKKDHTKKDHEKQHGKLSDKIEEEIKEKDKDHAIEEDEVIHKEFDEKELSEESEEEF